MAEVKGFSFWENYYNTISDPDNGLTDEERGQIYKAIVEFVFDGRKPSFKGTLKAIFSALLPSLEKSKNRSASGSRRTSKPETNGKQNESKTETKREQNESKTETKREQNESKTEAKNNFATPYRNKKEESIILTDNTKMEDIKGESEGEKEVGNGQEMFFKEFPNIVFDNYDPSALSELSSKDWVKLAEQFRASDWLRAKVKTMSKLCRMYQGILAEEYAPFKGGGKEEAELTEAERQANAEWFDKKFGSEA